MIRQRAHALTLLALFWIIFSLGAVFGELDSWNHGNHGLGGVSVSAVILLIHAVIIYFAIRLWRTEAPIRTNGEGFIADDLLDLKPNHIDLVKEKKRLKRIILSDIAVFLFLTIAGWFTQIYHLIGIGIFLGFILLLQIVFEIIRYLILKNRFNKSLK